MVMVVVVRGQALLFVLVLTTAFMRKNCCIQRLICLVVFYHTILCFCLRCRRRGCGRRGARCRCGHEIHINGIVHGWKPSQQHAPQDKKHGGGPSLMLRSRQDARGGRGDDNAKRIANQGRHDGTLKVDRQESTEQTTGNARQEGNEKNETNLSGRHLQDFLEIGCHNGRKARNLYLYHRVIECHPHQHRPQPKHNTAHIQKMTIVREREERESNENERRGRNKREK